MFRLKLFDTLKGFDSGTRFGADAEFLFRSFLHFKIGNVQKFLYRHTIRPDSLTQNSDTGFFSESRKQYNKPLFETIYAMIKEEQPIPEAGFLLSGQPAGLKEMPGFELIQLGKKNKTWIA